MAAPSYHDLHITTEAIPRTSIFNLPYGVHVTCNRVAGWQVVDMNGVTRDPRGRLPESWGVILAGEYDDRWLVLDVAGHVITDSRPGPDSDSETPAG